MLRQVAEGVFVHESQWCQTNTVVVHGVDGALVVDPGIHESELVCLAHDLSAAGHTVVAGFSTHPHWDHLLWHAALGDVPHHSTWVAATTARQRLAGGLDARRLGIPDDVSLDLIGQITGLPEDAVQVPWDGPDIQIFEHRAHAPGHAALLVAAALGEERGVLIAGDMLSDRFIPMLDLMSPGDPIENYLDALRLLAGVADAVEIMIPGHGTVADAGEARERIDRDRAYVLALQRGETSDDARIGPAAKPGWEWVRDVHARQVEALRNRDS